MTARTPQAIIETLCAHLREHGLRAVLVHPATTSAGRQYLATILVDYTEAEALAILKDAVRLGEIPADAEAADASEDE